MKRRWLVRAAVALALALPAAYVGVIGAKTDYAFGPHEASYQVTVNGRLTVDMGPLGTLVASSPLPAPVSFLGLRVVVGQIPEELEGIEAGPEPLFEMATQYVQMFTGMDTVVEEVARGLAFDAAKRFAIIWLGLLLVWLALAWVLGSSRRADLRFWWGRRRILAAVVALAVVVVAVGEETWRIKGLVKAEGTVVGSAVFKDTVFAGARVTGRLGQALDHYGAQAIEAYDQTNDFYDQAATAAEQALAAQQAKAELLGPPEKLAGVGRLTGGGAYRGLRPVVVASDLHCNVGMARVVGAVAAATGARLVLDAGDTTMDGTVVEQYCVDSFAGAMPSGVTTVAVGGNHDTNITAEQQAKAGIKVLKGNTVSVDGLRILGDLDPTHTELGQGTRSRRAETNLQMGLRLAEDACAQDPRPQVLLVHQASAARSALEQGCVDWAVSGHMHARTGPEVVGHGIGFVASSTGRDTREATTLGPLGAPAEVPVLLVNSLGQLVAWQLVTVNPDATVDLAPVELVPQPPAPGQLPADGGAIGSERASPNPTSPEGTLPNPSP
ncbi:MAG: metallophosphoesterase [Micrococcales bacterium]|nr:metallophosphoesterase [Micrococcales bacterium]